jgi:predicted Zn-dependent peptidase
LAKQALTNQSNAKMAGLCSVDSLLGLGANHFKETAAFVEQLTVEELRRVASKYLGQAKPTIVTVLPESK